MKAFEAGSDAALSIQNVEPQFGGDSLARQYLLPMTEGVPGKNSRSRTHATMLVSSLSVSRVVNVRIEPRVRAPAFS
jgi:hypothetical protein